MLSEDEEKVLLPTSDHDEPSFSTTEWIRNKERPKSALKACFWLYIVFLHICILLLCLAVVTDGHRRNYPPSQAFSLVTENPVLQADVRLDKDEKRYSGPPTPEQEAAWENLIAPAYISLSHDEIIGSPNPPADAVKISPKQGGGYLASLAVFHHLHCIHQLRMFVYSDYYFPNLTDANVKYLHEHADHCLETLRQSLMCKSDTSLRTFKWSDGEYLRVHGYSAPVRQCIDWEKLHRYMESKAVPYGPLLIAPDGSEQLLT